METKSVGIREFRAGLAEFIDNKHCALLLAMKSDDHRALRQWHDLARREHARLAPLADAIVTLSAPGALLQAPAVTLPLMSVQGLPVGAQLVGQADEDARIVSVARWVALEAGTVEV